MSSFDKTAGKNLDEILASIRKTLADETPHPDVKAGMPHAAADAKAPASANHNGSRPAADKIDEDLADLLAGGLDIPAATAVPGPKDTPGAADPKDPLWFLRPNEGRESQVLPLPADRVSASFEALANGPADPAPERSSLAPVFVADTGSQASPTVTGLTSAPAQANAAAAPAAEPRAPIEAKPLAKTSPRGADVPAANANKKPAQGAPLPEVAKTQDTAAKAPTPAPTAATSAPKADIPKPGTPASASTAAGPAAAPLKPPGSTAPVTAPNPVRPAEPARPMAAPGGAPLRAALGNGLGAPAKSAPVTARAAALNGAASTAASPPAAASAATVPTAQTQALEQIIEQLLEPLLRRWMEAHLPRLVDAAIRAEVARALDAKHVNGQDSDRKV
jgi:cell pole-organizing protein PopZ